MKKPRSYAAGLLALYWKRVPFGGETGITHDPALHIPKALILFVFQQMAQALRL